MYKRTARANARNELKKNHYMPALNILSERGLGSQWYRKPKKKEKHSSDTNFGMRFR